MTFDTAVKPGQTVKLSDYDPDDTFGITKDEAVLRHDELVSALGELQELLYASHQNSVLIVLQGMDTSGKDGTITKVMSGVNPLGCRVESFKVPTEEELDHDFLWRVHKVVPRRGMMTIFNRSHYEDVVIVRVHELVPGSVWKERYDQINEFEQLLTENGTIVLKFFLHISRDEQKERLEARERDRPKAWKLSPGDWKERVYWDDYQKAYEDAIARCSTTEAPWHIVPANKKWFRNLAVADAIVSTLRGHSGEWEKSLSELAKVKLAELAEFREQKGTLS
jgi:PPK2 family polyphosphate:nucleotide phosphotransferase